MALIDRLDRSVDHTQGPSSISLHAWPAALRQLSKGAFTRAQVVSAFGMSEEDEVQLDQVIAHFLGLSVEDRASWLDDQHDLALLWSAGVISRGTYLTKLGMS